MEFSQIIIIGISIFAWISCGLIGAHAAAKKEASTEGFLFGLFLGPIGILIAAIALDNRKQCPSCRERINTGATLCAACRTKVRWSNNETPILYGEFERKEFLDDVDTDKSIDIEVANFLSKGNKREPF